MGDGLGEPDPGEGADRSFFMDLYADMTRRYMAVSGAAAEDFAAVVVKNQHNGGMNPRAQYGGELSVDEVLAMIQAEAVPPDLAEQS